MSNKFVSQNYADLVSKFINKKYFNLFNPTFTVEDVEKYCQKHCIKQFGKLDEIDKQTIAVTVQECLESLMFVNMVKKTGNKFKAITYFTDEQQVYSFSSQFNNGTDTDSKTNWLKTWKESIKEHSNNEGQNSSL